VEKLLNYWKLLPYSVIEHTAIPITIIKKMSMKKMATRNDSVTEPRKKSTQRKTRSIVSTLKKIAIKHIESQYNTI